LAACEKHSGNVEELVAAVWQAPVRIKEVKNAPTRRRARLPLEAAVQYGLLEPSTYQITNLGRELVGKPRGEVFASFARYILLNLGGLRILEGIQQMRADGLRVTADELARFLSSQGFQITEHNTAINSLRMWLAEAGVFPRGRSRAWVIDYDVKEDLIGMDEDTLLGLSGLTSNQAAFVEALCVLKPVGWAPATDARDWAEAMRGVRMSRSSLPKEVLNALEDLGLIDYRTGGTGGGKTSELRLTDQFNADVLVQFVTRTLQDMDATVSAYYTERPEDIFAGLDSSDRHVKGQALEAFAVYVMRLLGLRFVAWRKRAEAEVDCLLSGLMGVIPTLWQIQCKNTPGTAVGIEDVAKEVGLLQVTNATHLLFVCTSTFSRDAVSFARRAMQRRPVAILFMDGEDVARIRENPASISHVLRPKAEGVIRELSADYFLPQD
jgi:site-specific DNA-methyltransferase (cytosine-N4-specific)